MNSFDVNGRIVIVGWNHRSDGDPDRSMAVQPDMANEFPTADIATFLPSCIATVDDPYDREVRVTVLNDNSFRVETLGAWSHDDFKSLEEQFKDLTGIELNGYLESDNNFDEIFVWEKSYVNKTYPELGV